MTEAGRERTCTILASLVDTNILVYRFDARFPAKQKIATEVLRRGILEDADSAGCQSAFRTDVDHRSEVMPISVPN
jgi:hypothetical protein